MTVRLAALGDSTSCGEGVGLGVPLRSTWPARLAAALPGGELVPLAAAGAKVRDVLRTQVQPALDADPHLVTCLIGLNDVSRGSFDPWAFAADLRAVVDAVLAQGATLLVGRLHDPTRLLPLPSALRAAVRARVAQVNACVDAAAGRSDVHVVDLAEVPALRTRPAWDVDRLHPTSAAHGHLAAAAATVLREAGLPVGPVPPPPVPTSAPGLLREAWWLARHGSPWLARHAREVVLPAAALARP